MINTEKAVSILLISSMGADSTASLTLARWSVQVVADSETARAAIKAQRPDILIAHDPDDRVLRLFQLLNDERPMLVLLLSSPPEPPLAALADFVLPAEPAPFIDFQLRAAFDLHRRTVQATGENERLRRDNARLRQQRRDQKRGVDEISLLKNAIVRNVSHELRTPLLQVKSAVALMAEDIPNKTLGEYATGAVARLEAIIKNITQLADTQNIKPTPVLVREAVDYASRNLRRAWEHKDSSARIQVDIEPHLPPVMADRQGLSTVLQLLMDNALKFSEGIVEVAAQRTGQQVRITVRDYGIGIAHDKLDSIFDSFYQIDSSSTRRYGGIGVGLAIVRLILDRHHVKIYVESVEGEGSTFWFDLPTARLTD